MEDDWDDGDGPRRRGPALGVLAAVLIGVVVFGVASRDDALRDSGDLEIGTDGRDADEPAGLPGSPANSSSDGVGAWAAMRDTPLPPAARGHAAWTGDEVAIVVDDLGLPQALRAAAYAPDADRWRPLPELPLGDLDAFGLVAAGDVLVLLWIDPGAPVLDRIDAQDGPRRRLKAATLESGADHWRALDDAVHTGPFERSDGEGSLLVAHDGQVTVVVAEDRLVRLDVAAGSWQDLPPPPIAARGAGLGVVDGTLILAGVDRDPDVDGPEATGADAPVDAHPAQREGWRVAVAALEDDRWQMVDFAGPVGTWRPHVVPGRGDTVMIGGALRDGEQAGQVALRLGADLQPRPIDFPPAAVLGGGWPPLVDTAHGVIAASFALPRSAVIRHPEADDSWQPLARLPVAHRDTTAVVVWTGEHLIIWGGTLPLDDPRPLRSGAVWSPAG